MTYQPAPSLTVHNAKTVLDAGLHAIAQGQAQFDLSQLTMVDSAAVATLLAWARAAQRSSKSLAFSHLPPNLHSLIDLYGVTDLLHVVPATIRADSIQGAAPLPR